MFLVESAMYSSDETSSDTIFHRYVESDTSDSSSTSSDSEVEPPKAKRQRTNLGMSLGAESNYTFCLKSNFRWLVNDSAEFMHALHKIGDKIVSPIFIVGLNDEFKWRLEFYPKGTESLRYPALNLCLISSTEPKIDVYYDCSILNHKNSNQTGHEYFKPGDHFAFKRFKALDAIAKSKSFTISCELIITIPKPSVHKIKVINDLKALFDSGSFSDVTLEIESKKFKVHKYILAARSVVFDAMFKSDMKEKTNNIVQISDISYDVMKELLRFTYTGEVENLNVIAKELLAAADKYAFEDLKTICENSLYENLNVDNVVDILNFAELYNASKLRILSLQYIVNNITDVIETPSFKNMGETQSPLLAQVICLMANKRKL